jgi:hypothetical protein
MSRNPFGTGVMLQAGLPLGGKNLAGHVCSIDTMSQPIISLHCRVAACILDDVRAKLAAPMGLRMSRPASRPPPSMSRSITVQNT